MFAALILSLALAPTPSPYVARPAGDCRLPSPAPSTAAEPNDNRAHAGTLRDGVLTVRLVAREAAWRPDGPEGCALPVHAFAEEGKLTQVPGPMIRVAAGTEVRVAVRNALSSAIWVRGLQDRTIGTQLDSVEVAPGATRDFRFVAATPGAWHYWARSGPVTRFVRSDADGQLVGALVVDDTNAAPSAGATPREDRVLVMTRWTPGGTADDKGFQVNAFNGRSWPNTERLAYTVGDPVRWHVINATNVVHEMHLHGFYYDIVDRGFVMDTAPRHAPTIGGLRAFGGAVTRVTAAVRPGEWITMQWSPDRAGNWLFHCHILVHMSGAQHLARMPGAAGSVMLAADHHVASSGSAHDDDMGGLVLGVDVRPSPTARAAPTSARPRRVIDLYADTRPNTFGDRPGYGFVMREGAAAPAADSIRIPGAPIVLTRGEPAQITVHNRLATPLGVHWHGLELESYYDGVGGFSGAHGRIAPMIAPGDSFVVRLTPPRAGTFMYHTHGERGEELASGLYGPFIVVDSGAPLDPRTDRVFVVADGGPGETRPLFVNGTAAPDTLTLMAGVTYRFRFCYITADDVTRTTLRGPGGLEPARLLAYGGYELPRVALPITRPFQVAAGPGHTADYAFTPGAPGEYTLQFERLAKQVNTPVGQPTIVPIRVRAP